MSFHNTSILEAVWIMVTFFGLLYSSRNAFEAHRDHRAVVRAGVANGRLVLARASARGETIRAAAMGSWLVVGMVSAAGAYPLSPPVRASVVAGLVLGIILTVVNSVMDRRARMRVIAAVRAKPSVPGHDLRTLAATAPFDPPPVEEEDV